MKKIVSLPLALAILTGCTVSSQITDPESVQIQKEMRRFRTSQNLTEAGVLVGATIISATLGTESDFGFSEPNFKKIRISNVSNVPLVVNMVTDIQWNADQYCDIKGIVIHAKESVQVITPIGASYNVYFRPLDSEVDEHIEINTSARKNFKLKPGIGIPNDTISALSEEKNNQTN